MIKIEIEQITTSKPGGQYSEIWWSLIIHVGDKKVLSETCWDYHEASAKAAAFVAAQSPTPQYDEAALDRFAELGRVAWAGIANPDQHLIDRTAKPVPKIPPTTYAPNYDASQIDPVSPIWADLNQRSEPQ